MKNVQRYGIIPDMVYGHDKFGPVTSHTEPGYFVAEHEFDRVTAERDEALGREAALIDQLDAALRQVKANWDYAQDKQQRLTAADERLDAGISLVTRMIKCAGGQPSIATSYLRDISDKLKPAEGGGDD